jgi:hypothetical protein
MHLPIIDTLRRHFAIDELLFHAELMRHYAIYLPFRRALPIRRFDAFRLPPMHFEFTPAPVCFSRRRQPVFAPFRYLPLICRPTPLPMSATPADAAADIYASLMPPPVVYAAMPAYAAEPIFIAPPLAPPPLTRYIFDTRRH